MWWNCGRRDRGPRSPYRADGRAIGPRWIAQRHSIARAVFRAALGGIAVVATICPPLTAQPTINQAGQVKQSGSSSLCIADLEDLGPGPCYGHALRWRFTRTGFTSASPAPSISPLSSDPRSHTSDPLTPGSTTPSACDFNGDGWCDIPFSWQTSSLLDVGVYQYLVECTYTIDFQTEYNCQSANLFLDIWNSPAVAAISRSGATAVGETVTLDANASDPDGGSVGVFWRIVTASPSHAASLSTSSGQTTTLSFVDERDIGSWTIAADVDDDEGERRTFTTSFTVPNIPPSISVNGATEVPALGTIDLSASTTKDLDGGPDLSLTWDILSAPPGASRGAQSGFSTAPSIGWTTTESDIGTWRFRLTAKDNENTTDAAEVEVHVTNLEPVITLDRPGPYIVSQGATFTLTNTTPDDPDGGTVTHDWELVQSPVAAGVTLGPGFASSPTLTLTTNASAAGTWIWVLHMRDNEGAEKTQEVQLLVDAPVHAAVTGPAKQNQILGFVLDGTGSNDPDSPDASVPNRGHQTSRGSVVVSPGIVSYAWSLVDIPVEAWGRYVTGPIEYSLDAANGAPTLSIGPADLRPGTWTFALHVIDGEGNEDEAQFTVEVLEPNTRPIALVPSVTYGLTDVTGNVLTDIGTNATASFDLDNLLSSAYTPGLGITNYSWQIVSSPPACPASVTPPNGATASTFTLFAAGTTVDPTCIATWLTRVTVTDDEPSPTTLTGTADGAVVMANCPGEVCIDYPTSSTYQYVEFADNTDVTIVYHLNSAVYTDPIFAAGARLDLAIFHESDLTTPVYTGQFDYDMLSILMGGRPTAHWSGFTNAGLRPQAGKYDVRLRITNPLLPTPYSEATQPQSIWLEVVDIKLNTVTADQVVSTSGMKAGTDRFHLDFSVTGHFAMSASYDQAKLRVTSVATNTVVANVDIPSPLSGTVNWNGELVPGSGTYIAPGDYRADIEVLKSGHSLGRSSPVTFTAYGVTVEVVGTPASERWTPGATFAVGGAAREVKVSVAPAPTTGTVSIATSGAPGAYEFKDGGATVATDVPGGASFPASAFATPKTFQVRAVLASATAAKLLASYLPAGAAMPKTAKDSAQLLGLDVQLAAMCSDTTQAYSDGIFVERLPATPSAATFGELRLLMHPVRVQADRVLDPAATDVTLDIESGSANVVLLAGGSAYTPLGASKTWHASDFNPVTHKLDVPVFVAGVAGGEAVLRLRYLKGGTEMRTRRVKVRVSDLPGLAGRATAVAPQFLFGRVFNIGETVTAALDPSRYADRVGRKAAVYVVPHRARSAWAASNSLAGAVAGPIPVTLAAGGTSANVAALGAALPAGDYDVVYDFGNCPLDASFATDGTLDPGDLTDELAVDAPSLSVIPSAVAPGPFATASAEYGMVAPITKTHITSPMGLRYDGLAPPGYDFRLRGLLVYPTPLPVTPRPLVVIAHGNHFPLSVPGVGATPLTITSDENFRGHTYLQTLLASYGYITLSVDLDEMFGGGGTLPDITGGGIVLRGNVILRNIEEVLTNATIAGGALTGKIDKSRVYLLGHSRGGEAVLTAWSLYTGGMAKPSGALPYVSGLTIKGIISVSPVSAHTVTLPAGMPYLLIYGSADGDVNGASPGVQPFVHYDRAEGPAQMIYAIGANHNFFNNSWAYDDATQDLDCSSWPGSPCTFVGIAAVGANLRSKSEQQDLLKAYTLAFLKVYEDGDARYGAYFTTPPALLRPLGVASAIPLTYLMKPQPGGQREILDDFQTGGSLAVASSGAAVTYTVSSLTEEQLMDPDPFNLADESGTTNRFFQDTRGALFDWASASDYTITPTSTVDMRGARLAFRLAQQPLPLAPAGPLDLAVTLVDAANVPSTITVGAWAPINGIYVSQVPVYGETTKAVFETRMIPGWAFVANGSTIDLQHIKTIRFDFAAPGGRIAIDDVEIWR